MRAMKSFAAGAEMAVTLFAVRDRDVTSRFAGIVSKRISTSSISEKQTNGPAVFVTKSYSKSSGQSTGHSRIS